ncbi:hypothetical protein, partial [Serratia phage KSP20]
MPAGLSPIFATKCAILRRHFSEGASNAGRHAGSAVPATLRHHARRDRNRVGRQSGDRRTDIFDRRPGGRAAGDRTLNPKGDGAAMDVIDRLWSWVIYSYSTVLMGIGMMTQREWLATGGLVIGLIAAALGEIHRRRVARSQATTNALLAQLVDAVRSDAEN